MPTIQHAPVIISINTIGVCKHNLNEFSSITQAIRWLLLRKNVSMTMNRDWMKTQKESRLNGETMTFFSFSKKNNFHYCLQKEGKIIYAILIANSCLPYEFYSLID